MLSGQMQPLSPPARFAALRSGTTQPSDWHLGNSGRQGRQSRSGPDCSCRLAGAHGIQTRPGWGLSEFRQLAASKVIAFGNSGKRSSD